LSFTRQRSFSIFKIFSYSHIFAIIYLLKYGGVQISEAKAGKNSLPAGRQASPQPPFFLPDRFGGAKSGIEKR